MWLLASFVVPAGTRSGGPMTTRTIDIYRGPATIEMDEGGMLEVDCRYSVEQELVEAGTERPASTSWSGSFTTDEPLTMSGGGVLHLEDGRSARITITDVHLGVGGGTFAGAGAPPD